MDGCNFCASLYHYQEQALASVRALRSSPRAQQSLPSGTNKGRAVRLDCGQFYVFLVKTLGPSASPILRRVMLPLSRAFEGRCVRAYARRSQCFLLIDMYRGRPRMYAVESYVVRHAEAMSKSVGIPCLLLCTFWLRLSAGLQ